MRFLIWILSLLSACAVCKADGRLWLRYGSTQPGENRIELARAELKAASFPEKVDIVVDSTLAMSRDGYRLDRRTSGITLSASTDLGVLYGCYDLIRRHLIGNLDSLGSELCEPAFDLRILNHWDNPDGTIERGYAGHSIWLWDELPGSVSPRYREYARANASIGINATVINNVNASPSVLSAATLEKVAAIADELRPYGMRVFLSVNFASPMALGGLEHADPLDENVAAWWKEKADEIYRLIPDFGGFLVKANSEGQPGPCDYGRTHAQGANMLARALAPHGGIVMWRAFVYSPSDADRAKQAYLEFQPLDGQFDSNVIVQIKNGPIDFQPREPYSPLFGAMPSTAQMVEFQITQEYLGHSNHLAYLAPMWSEFYDYVPARSLVAVAGVSNIGDSPEWTAHPLAQANWYAFGRLAWNPDLTPASIAAEWGDLSIFDRNVDVPQSIKNTFIDMMTASREAVVDYMMPMGLHHIFAWGHHYGPEPWCDIPGARADWLPRYYHCADTSGIGFDRTPSGSDALSQYPADLAAEWGDAHNCPVQYLLWFHHLPWNWTMSSGDTLWQELCRHYQRGLDSARKLQTQWSALRPWIDDALYNDVALRMTTQVRDAQWWKDACLGYFGQISGMPLPADVEPSMHDLKTLQRVKLPISNYECPTPAMLDSVR